MLEWETFQNLLPLDEINIKNHPSPAVVSIPKNESRFYSKIYSKFTYRPQTRTVPLLQIVAY